MDAGGEGRRGGLYRLAAGRKKKVAEHGRCPASRLASANDRDVDPIWHRVTNSSVIRLGVVVLRTSREAHVDVAAPVFTGYRR